MFTKQKKNYRNHEFDENKIIKIQSLWKGYIVRKNYKHTINAHSTKLKSNTEIPSKINIENVKNHFTKYDENIKKNSDQTNNSFQISKCDSKISNSIYIQPNSAIQGKENIQIISNQNIGNSETTSNRKVAFNSTENNHIKISKYDNSLDSIPLKQVVSQQNNQVNSYIPPVNEKNPSKQEYKVNYKFPNGALYTGTN